MDFLKDLNKEQSHAVVSDNPYIVITAGPGTGKTKTLVSRIGYLVTKKNIDPAQILALTFTKKAASEMKERMDIWGINPYISTFHGFAYDLLSRERSQKIRIITDRQRQELLEMILHKLYGKTFRKKDVQEVLLSISLAKNGDNSQEEENAQLLHLYNAKLSEMEMVDYDDLLIKLKHSIDTSSVKFTHVLVDEFQDTNILQYELIKKIVRASLFVIGDPQQSIYGFRGARSEVFDKVKKDYPHSESITLTKNYRSTKEIITACEHIFPKSSVLQPVRKEKGSVKIIATLNETAESEWIVRKIQTLIGGADLLQSAGVSNQTNCRISDIAVVYRTHHTGRSISRALEHSGIPYQIIGGNSLFEKPIIYFITILLRYINKPGDDILEELCYSTGSKLTTKIRHAVRTIQESERISYKKALYMSVHQSHLVKKDTEKIKNVIHLIDHLSRMDDTASVSQYLDAIIQYQNIPKDSDIQQFITIAYQFENKGLTAFVRYLDYLYEHEFFDPKADRVTLMTIHAAKGLEFENVILCGFEEGILPFASQRYSTHIDEEKRLFYVALTRAKTRLYLTYAKRRRHENRTISSFAALLQKSGVEEVSDEANEQIQKKIRKWQAKKNQMKLF